MEHPSEEQLQQVQSYQHDSKEGVISPSIRSPAPSHPCTTQTLPDMTGYATPEYLYEASPVLRSPLPETSGSAALPQMPQSQLAMTMTSPDPAHPIYRYPTPQQIWMSLPDGQMSTPSPCSPNSHDYYPMHDLTLGERFTPVKHEQSCYSHHTSPRSWSSPEQPYLSWSTSPEQSQISHGAVIGAQPLRLCTSVSVDGLPTSSLSGMPPTSYTASTGGGFSNVFDGSLHIASAHSQYLQYQQYQQYQQRLPVDGLPSAIPGSPCIMGPALGPPDGGMFTTMPPYAFSQADTYGAPATMHGSIEGGSAAAKSDEPYAQLIFKAFMSTPSHAMTLREIYQWFRDNTDKAKAESKGWQNSIRHNLSMNNAFQKRDCIEPTMGEDGKPKKTSEWVLEPWAAADGVQATTRYRAQNSTRRGGPVSASRQELAAHAMNPRVVSGRKGGQAASKSKKKAARTAAERSSLRLQQQKQRHNHNHNHYQHQHQHTATVHHHLHAAAVGQHDYGGHTSVSLGDGGQIGQGARASSTWGRSLGQSGAGGAASIAEDNSPSSYGLAPRMGIVGLDMGTTGYPHNSQDRNPQGYPFSPVEQQQQQQQLADVHPGPGAPVLHHHQNDPHRASTVKSEPGVDDPVTPEPVGTPEHLFVHQNGSASGGNYTFARGPYSLGDVDGLYQPPPSGRGGMAAETPPLFSEADEVAEEIQMMSYCRWNSSVSGGDCEY